MLDRPSFVRSCLGAALLVQAAACGGKVVFVEDGEGGAPGTGGFGGDPNPVTSSSISISASSSNSSVTTVGVGGGGPGLTEDAIFDNVTEPIGFNIGPGTLGITALASAADPFAEIQATRVTAPSGSLVVDGIVPSNDYAWFWYGAVAIATPQVDHPESIPLAQGNWFFEFQSSAPTNVSIWRRSTIDGAFHGGVIDVNVFAPDGLIDEDDVLANIADAYGNWGGIELGDVRFFPLSDDYFVVDENNIFDLALETNAAQTRPALNIMATASIEGEFEGAAGFALGLPGYSMVHGTNASAVVWMVLYDDFYDPIIMRHEAGHFGGLFHTSEFQAGLGDPLDDTPLCADASVNFGQDCPDYDYIMFPTGGSGAGLFSPKESTVLQASTIYRGVYAEGEAPMTPYGPPLEPTSGSLPRKASPLEIATAKLHAQARRASGAVRAPAAGSWSAGLPSSVTEQLRGIGCASGSSGTTYLDDLESLGATDADEMIAVARDASAPAYVRRRAALMAGRLGVGSTGVADALDALARDTSQPSLLRSGALRSLTKVSTQRARATSTALAGDGDKLVARAVAAVQ